MKIPKINIIRQIDVTEYEWCDSAVLIDVSDGKAALKKVTSYYGENDYTRRSQLLLNGKPIMQGRYPDCPTCSAMLARGYGIEKTNTPELLSIREKINADFTDFKTAVENIESILGLLEDGYYVIADAKLYTTSGEDYFFANVPDKMSYIDSACSDYYSSDFFDVTESFPAYIYPTQSNDCLYKERAKYYLNRIDKENAPRAIAYYDYGFLCALLDGHHKAYAAAMKGVQLRTLLIIPVTAYMSKEYDKVCFADIVLPLDYTVRYRPFKPLSKRKIVFEDYHNVPISEDGLCLECYPTVKELTGFLAAELDGVNITERLVLEWLTSTDADDYSRLKYALLYNEKKDIEKAFIIAKTILSYEYVTEEETQIALCFLIRHKSDKAEQLIVDYLIDHNPTDSYWGLANSYWSKT
ncbi:MAG: hypothetical protein PUG48_12260 [Clostridia bacterium]|nr:hypothetical protein [Clostridia bacterium]